MDVDSSSEQELQPTDLNTSNHGHGLEISKDKLTVRYVGEGRHDNDVGAIQANRPVPVKQLVYYYEVTVLDQGEYSRISVGFSDKNFKLTRQPGWEPNSYGYHGDDGRRFHAQPKGDEYGPTFGTGDTIGAGIHWGRQEIFYTKNGTKLKTAFKGVKGPLYPTVGLHSKNECVEVNFGQKPFKFDIEGMIQEEREQQRAAVQSIKVSTGVVHQVVRKFLLHYGYAETLKAFDAAAGLGDNAPVNDEEAAALELRQAIRRAILNGDIDKATSLIQSSFPQLLQEHSGFDVVSFHLCCQKYIELLREAKIEQAVLYAQTSMASFRQKLPQYETTLRDVVALIAYENPQDSPLKHFLSLAHREKVADAVNSAILTLSAGEPPSFKPTSLLERLLKQVVVVSSTLHEHNGGHGEVFRLRDYLSQPTQP